jgi:hypothetical protein
VERRVLRLGRRRQRQTQLLRCISDAGNEHDSTVMVERQSRRNRS